MTGTTRVRWEGVKDADEIIEQKPNHLSKMGSNSLPLTLTPLDQMNQSNGQKVEAVMNKVPSTNEHNTDLLKKQLETRPDSDESQPLVRNDGPSKGEKGSLDDKFRPNSINFLPGNVSGDPSRQSSGCNTPVSPHSKRRSHELAELWKHYSDKSATGLLSALYCIVLFILGLAFPLSQVISSKIPKHYYEGFYVYLYTTAIVFLIYTYILSKTPYNFHFNFKRIKRLFIKPKTSAETPDLEMDHQKAFEGANAEELRFTLDMQLDISHPINHGSFYLRIGAVVFGIGAMIYSGIDFGQYFEMKWDSGCGVPIFAISPASRMIFTFLQMYFVFLNVKMQMVKKRSPKFAQFGLMHILATNMCVWLNAIIEETKHEIHLFGHTGDSSHHESGASDHKVHSSHDELHLNSSDSVAHQRHHRALPALCQGSNLMTSLMESASPFLYPCAIEYSLICAAVMYEIWIDSGHCHRDGYHSGSQTAPDSPAGSRRHSIHGSRRSPNHYSVDCTKANKGLFFGIFVLVMTIIAMILFFVLINRDDYKSMAITEVHLAELILYSMTLASVIIGMVQMRKLKFDTKRSLNLDEVLIIVAQCGNITYSIFTILGAQFSDHPEKLLILLTSFSALVQGICQTIFILDASKRTLYTREQQHRKPGREIVTFLLVTNFAMWATTTMEKSRTDAHPVQAEFYGLWQWAIITNISMPLTIFYRYHSTVCLCEIWKRCYKVRYDLN